MKNVFFFFASLLTFPFFSAAPAYAQEPGIPFKQKIEVYRDREGDVMIFALNLDQPFLDEEFEKSNYLRLRPLDDNVWLVYPNETRFEQKHANFYGRLRGEGKAKLRLSWEIVAENPDGTRHVQVRHADLEIEIPKAETGPIELYRGWARKQNDHFLELLKHYPQETFLQFCLLQSKERYGIVASAPHTLPDKILPLEQNLFKVFTGSLAVQQALQSQSYTNPKSPGGKNIHISQVEAPKLESLPYEELLDQLGLKGKKPAPKDIARLIPDDQYLLQFDSITAAWEMLDLVKDWGDGLLRLFAPQARHNRLQEKLEDQLCIRRDPLTRLFADQAIAEVAATGSDPFIFEGTDLTLIFRVKAPNAFDAASAAWMELVRKKYPSVSEREFNYRGHKISARYTEDRTVSSFVLRHGDFAIFSNSHVAIRKIVDCLAGQRPTLWDALDYRYLTALLPPQNDPGSGYFFVPEAFIKRMVGPAMKISEKRRLECFNNLVMINNASLFHRLELGKGASSLAELEKGRFIDMKNLFCPDGGTYAFDVAQDTATCSLHNRIKYLTPNAELNVLQVSNGEAQEYARYRENYRRFWQGFFDPIAVRLATAGSSVRLETCVVPLANGSVYHDLQEWLHDTPKSIDTANSAKSTIATLGLTLGRDGIGQYLKGVPGIPEVLEADPTLTDLSWIGNGMTMNLCDGDLILEVDPGQLDARALGPWLSLPGQSLAAAGLLCTSLPAWVAIEVTDRGRAEKFLEQLSSRIFLRSGYLQSIQTTFDAYRLPDYKEHAIYVMSYQVYALKVRLYVALVGDQLIAATRPFTLHEVIDALSAAAGGQNPVAHMTLRLNFRGLQQAKNDLELYWSEKARLACHSNIMSLYVLLRLYGVPLEELPRVSEAKYGVVYYCPDGGQYEYDAAREQVVCTVHGNRQASRLHSQDDRQTSFKKFFNPLNELNASLRFEEDGLFTVFEIHRKE